MNKPYPPLASLVPHGPPMLLLDELLDVSDESAVTRVTITPASPFFDHGGVPAIISLEYMAQTIAALAGVQLQGGGKRMKFGFLIACRQLTFHVDAFANGDDLRVEVHRSWVSDKMGEYSCQVSRAGKIVADGIVTVYEGGLEIREAPAEANGRIPEASG